MKTLIFGNPNTDSWKLSLDDISVEEHIVALEGELRTGFFFAMTPMCISPSALADFLSQVQQLDRTLTGTATLESRNVTSQIIWRLTVLPLGHVESAGCFTVRENSLDFSFRTDQTQLAPLARWLSGLLAAFDRKRSAEPRAGADGEDAGAQP